MSDKKFFSIFFIALLLSIFSAGISDAAEKRAFSDEIGMYTASDINVDIIDKDAASARRHAISNGQSLGLFNVLERIVDPNQFGNLPEVSDDEIADMVQDIEISDEKTSKVRYIASLNIHYKPSVIRKFLTDNNISFVQKPSQPYLLLPIYREGHEVFLWESPNSWAGAWKKVHPALVPLVIPTADENDIVKIQLKDICSENKDALKNWQNIYAVGGVIVAEVKNSNNRLKFTATMYRNGEKIETVNLSSSYTQKESLPAALKNLADNYIGRIESEWRDANLVNIADDTFITVIVPMQSLTDWLYVQKQLKLVATITKIELKATTKNKAQIELWFADGIQNLRKSLKKNGLVLKEIYEDVYEIAAFRPDPVSVTEEITNE